ncbi:hypothetical protein ACQKWADRAFT_240997 [Trichoderma austrokoningii]
MPPAPSRRIGGVSTSSASASVSLPSLPGAPPATASSSSSPTSSIPATPIARTRTATSAASTCAPPAPAPAPISTSAPTASSASLSRPGFLARLGSSINLPFPLRSRNRSVADFHVRCDEPHRKYNAGDHVHGAVAISVVKSVRYTHLVVALHGFVRVLKDPAGSRKGRDITALPQGGNSSRPQYHGNGFASLFQDEQVLSGEGRLDPGRFEFRFDLVFPDKGLPSSIDFERGTISYMITATLTRPVSMSPTMTCERKVVLAERIDVGLVPPPAPRIIFLEPINRKMKKKKSSMALDKTTFAAPEAVDVASSKPDAQEPPVEDSTDQQSERRGAATSSDVQSEISGESGRSIGTTLSRSDFTQLSHAGTAAAMSAQQQAVNDNTITASIELLKGGCLPGDAVSVRVTVQHIKQIKSMTGVIVTLFRQGKIDSSPPSQLFKNMMTREDARRLQKEDIYPKSRTGLGGISLTSTGSVSVFRKDLDQTTAPLIIDPATLSASVTVPVKIPDDSFPTIKGVPGDMISFKYQVEVLVDLGGKLSGNFPARTTSRYATVSNSSAADQSINMFSQRRGAQIEIIDTTPLRRHKGIVCVALESVVGTVDSSGTRKLIKVSSSSRTLDTLESDDEVGVVLPTLTRYEDIDCGPPPPPRDYFPPHTDSQRPSYTPHDPSRPSYGQTTNPNTTPSYIPPPPQFPDQKNLSEKDRIRQAEQRLLPSQPPAGPSNIVAPTASPSAPDEDDIYDAQATPRQPHAEDDTAPSAPSEAELTAATNASSVPAEEDKQERERRRLMQEASAPPEFPEDMDQSGHPGRAPRDDELTADAEPTAPMLDEDGDGRDYPGYGAVAGPSAGGTSTRTRRDNDNEEQLPAYQR